MLLPRPTVRDHFFLAVLLQVIAAFTALGAPLPTSTPIRRSISVTPPNSASPGFTFVPPSASGISFTNRLDEDRSLTNQIFLNGSGVALGDVDGDGRTDLYLCGLDTPNALYRNLGEWRFNEITSTAGVACENQASTGAAFADVDGDGDLDLLVNGIAQGTRLFLNNGRAVFSEATDAWGLRSTAGATSFALADVDGDGWIDLYVVHYRNDTMRDLPGMAFTAAVTNGVRQLLTVNGQSASAPPWADRFTLDSGGGILENGEADAFYHNTGRGRFVRRPWAAGGPFFEAEDKPAAAPYDWGLSAMFHDLNGDRAPDLYVCNDFQSPDRIWINDGSGRFFPIAGSAIRQTSLFSMGVDVADVNRDGHDDIFVADMLSPDHRLRQVQVMDAQAFAQIRSQSGPRPQVSRNTLFLNRGDSTYSEIAQLAGVDASDWSWCPVFLDVDLDGYEDLLVTTGHWRDAQHADVARELETEAERKRLNPREQLRLRRRFPRLETPNIAFRNRGDLTFAECGSAWGFDSRRISQGIALADLDGDGDLDAVVNCLNDGPLLLRNNASAPRLAIRLRGAGPNSSGIGARIRVHAPGLPVQTHEVTLGGRYLSADDRSWCFAAGPITNRLRVEVTWRDGSRIEVPDLPANQFVELSQSSGSVGGGLPNDSQSQDATGNGAAPPPAFEDLTHLLGHVHTDASQDDFSLQPLLPHRLSHAGPGLSWFDFNGDGWEDLLVGSGQGGRLAVFRNNTQGGFIPQRARILETPVEHDQLAVLGWRESTTNLMLFLSADGSSAPPSGTLPLRAISLVSGSTQENILPDPASGGPLAMGDIDGDGDLDLFVGGRSLPGRFPTSAPSFLLRNRNGAFSSTHPTTLPLSLLGPVNGAVFTDLDLDGRPELAVVSEWGTPTLFRWNGTNLSTLDPTLRWPTPNPDNSFRPNRLSDLTGWWNSIASGDFDNDGRLDLILGNWGRNTSRQRFLQKPLRLLWTSSDPGTPVRWLESHRDPLLGIDVAYHDRATLGTVFPEILNRFPTFSTFATSSLDGILEAIGPLDHERSAVTLDSILLLQRSDYLEARPLPAAAQVAPVFGIAVGDLDGDGNEDAFLAQNCYVPNPSESRHDAGAGVWLKGNGKGEFRPVTTSESGIRVLGDARGAALADFDHDGRLDLSVTQNRGPTRLFRNSQARPGIAVRLTGPPKNPQAIGAIVRLESSDGTLGPAHELHLGAGYLSQDSPVSILGSHLRPVAVHLLWPGGEKERIPIPMDAKELQHKFPSKTAPSP